MYQGIIILGIILSFNFNIFTQFDQILLQKVYIMWNQLEKISPILVGQSVFSCLDLKSIVKLETALASSEGKQIFCSFLSYYSNDVIQVFYPKDKSKIKWLQSHNFPISKAIVRISRNILLEGKLINEIELVNYNMITKKAVDSFPDCLNEKVVSVNFSRSHRVDFIVKLFSRFHNLRELKFEKSAAGVWVSSVLEELRRVTNNNILIEKVTIYCNLFYVGYGSITEIARYCFKLKSLTVEYEIGEDSILALSKYCPLLTELNIPLIPRITTEQSAAICAPVLSCIYSITT